MEGCPPPSRVPSSISSETPAVPFTSVAQTACTRRARPMIVELAKKRSEHDA